MNTPSRRPVLLFSAALLLVGSLYAAEGLLPGAGEKWRALHLIGYGNDKSLEGLAADVPRLAALGINAIVLEVDYSFAFKSHPELRRGSNPITKKGAGAFVKKCRDHGVLVIPQFQCLAHQSWKENTGPLLTTYPELDLTPGAFPGNKGIYCREWDPLNPKVNEIVFALMDELIEAFGATMFHVGMDEVFLIGSEHSPSTRGKDPAKVFAKAVTDIHAHLVKKRGLQMMMWGDRLIDGKELAMGKWEASQNGTAPAVDMIPKDIVICPWHYGKRETYPSIPLFLKKGFRVLPAGWNKVDATEALIRYAATFDSPLMLGHLFTTWSRRRDLVAFPPMVRGLRLLKDLADAQPFSTRRVPYKTINETTLYMDVYSPKNRTKPLPAIVFFFGGGWVGGSPRQFYPHCEYCATRGMVAISAEYRVRNRHGTTPFECVEDGKSAVRYVRAHAKELGIDPTKVAAGGGSAGGHVAACTGVIKGLDNTNENLQISSVPDAMVLFNPVLDTTFKGYGAKRFKGRETEISPVHHIRRGLPPTIIFHGKADTTVPFENAERYRKLAAEAGNVCILRSYEGKKHGFFNYGRRGGEFRSTLIAADAFLASLKFIAGAHTVDAYLARKASGPQKK